jgi:hypothetical protein
LKMRARVRGREAKKRKTSYQRMIRNLLSHYARTRQASAK